MHSVFKDVQFKCPWGSSVFHEKLKPRSLEAHGPCSVVPQQEFCFRRKGAPQPHPTGSTVGSGLVLPLASHPSPCDRPAGQCSAKAETWSLTLRARLSARHSLKVSSEIWETGTVKKISNLPGHVNSSFNVATEIWKGVLSCGWTLLMGEQLLL